MPRKSSRSSQTSQKRKSKANTLKFVPLSSQTGQNLRPVTKPPPFDLVSPPENHKATKNAKGKGKVNCPPKYSDTTGDYEDRLWVDIYQPTTEAELAVHKRKVDDVRRWLQEAFEGGPSGKLRKYRRILALTGPAGVGKTITVRVLARELGIDVLEWKNSIDDRFGDLDFEGEALMQKFNAFLRRASACNNVLSTANPTPSFSSGPGAAPRSTLPRPHIILLEDLPNLLHGPTQAIFHSALQSMIDGTAPVVVIVSDAGLRGEDIEENSGWRRKEAVDVRTALGPLLKGPYVSQIAFNPVAPTLLRRALQTLLSAEFSKPSSSSKTKFHPPSKDLLDAIIDSSNGDIRNAIMSLQISCIVNDSSAKHKDNAKFSSNRQAAPGGMVAITNREQNLQLFHLLGKVLYNKRKGDPPQPSATVRDIRRDEDLDNLIKDPSHLPPWLADHERRASRINVNILHADTPIDSSLFGLYIHQNYAQFCDGVEQCERVADWLSWIDWSGGGEAWHQCNPHQFHLLVLGTLHSLPSPVARRSQQLFKPEWFEVVRKEKDAWDAVGDVRDWIYSPNTSAKAGYGILETDNAHHLLAAKQQGIAEPYLGLGWSRTAIATQLGGVLKALSIINATPRPPSSHRVFSTLSFVADGLVSAACLAENDMEDFDVVEEEFSVRGQRETDVSEGGWLQSDDIEEF